MRGKSLAVLFVLAVVFVALAMLSTRRASTVATPPPEGRLVLPDLAVNDVTRMVIVNQSATTTVQKTDGVWRVAEKHGFPANFDRVRTALIALADLKIGDQRATTPESRQEFGLLEPGPAHPDATRIRLERADGQVLANLLLGKHHVRKAQGNSPYGGDYPDGRYVSPDDGITAYMVKQTLSDLTAASMSWIEAELLNVDAAELVRVSIAGAGRDPVELTAPDGAPLTVNDVGEQQEVDEAKVSSLRNALAYLNLQDVAAPTMTDEELGFKEPVTFTAGTKDGRVVTVQLGAKAEADARYMRCAVTFEEPPPPAAPADTNAPAPPVPDHTATRLAAETLDRKLTGWTFIIPSYKAESMLITRAELVKPKAPAGAEAAPAAPETTEEAPAAATPVTEEMPATPPAVDPPAAPPAPEPAAPAETTTNTPNPEAQS